MTGVLLEQLGGRSEDNGVCRHGPTDGTGERMIVWCLGDRRQGGADTVSGLAIRRAFEGRQAEPLVLGFLEGNVTANVGYIDDPTAEELALRGLRALEEVHDELSSAERGVGVSAKIVAFPEYS